MKLVIGLIVGAVVGAGIGYLVWGRQVSDLQARVAQMEARLASPPPAPAPAPKVAPATAASAFGAAMGKNPNLAVIEVSGAFGANCTVKVNPPLIGNKKNYKVYWVLDGDDAACGRGNWRVELHFDNAANGTVYNGDQDVAVSRDTSTKYKIKNSDNAGLFPYHIWYVQTSGPGAPKRYEMADPELEIEQ
jgi:hypothetical protein